MPELRKKNWLYELFEKVVISTQRTMKGEDIKKRGEISTLTDSK
jgi:hypothetical protein